VAGVGCWLGFLLLWMEFQSWGWGAFWIGRVCFWSGGFGGRGRAAGVEGFAFVFRLWGGELGLAVTGTCVPSAVPGRVLRGGVG